ncbi:RNA polymerase sigma factor [Kiloniella sp.]|uniref:RNA polymerase sigma factor n=1 Tax=Kiloniella sp. TaxID=1938587 RepID=UPI003B01490A
MTEVGEKIVSLLPQLRRFAIGLCGDISLADDLVQTACEKAIKNQSQWQEGTRLDSWVFRIIQNLYLDHSRANTIRRDYALNTANQSESCVDGVRALESRYDLGVVGNGLDQLSLSQRSILLMVCVEDMSYRQVAQTLDIPLGTVMSRLARARQQLHQILSSDNSGVVTNKNKEHTAPTKVVNNV